MLVLAALGGRPRDIHVAAAAFWLPCIVSILSVLGWKMNWPWQNDKSLAYFNSIYLASIEPGAVLERAARCALQIQDVQIDCTIPLFPVVSDALCSWPRVQCHFLLFMQAACRDSSRSSVWRTLQSRLI